MYLASAYPNSAIPFWQMLVVAVVALGALGIWIGMVFAADKASSKKESAHVPVLARQAPVTDDGQGQAAPLGGHGAAA